MAPAAPDAASFRDPAGRIYHLDGRILRSVTAKGAADYEFVRDSGLLESLTSSGRLIVSREVEPEMIESGEDLRYLLEHPRLSFISYPYEWCFSALKAAALLQLDFLLESLEQGVTLRDASSFNIQFVGPRPLFIDVLSFCRYQEGAYWLGHRQFCEQFLNPLLLTSKRGVPFNAWLRGGAGGLPGEELSRLLPWWSLLDWKLLGHVFLPALLQRRAEGAAFERQGARIKASSLPRPAFKNLLTGLRSWIERLRPGNALAGAWSDYGQQLPYGAKAFDDKLSFVRDFARSVRPARLWDLGCNDATFTEAALEAGAEEATGFDSDHGALEQAFARARDRGLKLLPLYLDAADPSPALGWRGEERKSLAERAKAEGLLALAFLHHLAIGRNIPLGEALSWLVSLAPQGVIEFVEKNDPTIMRMLALREDIFPDYHREAFRTTLLELAEIVAEREIAEGRRLLVWYSRRAR